MSEIVREFREAVQAVRERARALTITSDDDVAEVQALLSELAEAEAQLAGARLMLLGEAQSAGAYGAVDQARSSPRTTTGRASGTLRLSRELSDRFWVLADALCEGRISEAQAEAIVTGLKRLPVSLGRADLERCQRQLLEYCDELGPKELQVAATRMWELLDPEGAEECEAKRLAEEERRAKANRSLRLTPDHHGSMLLSGQLPVADAALLEAQLDALMPSAASYVADGDTLVPEPDARRADALMLLAAIAASASEIPDSAGDRPHVHVTMPLSTLIEGVGRGDLVGSDGEAISAREARRLACDAGLIPNVLGSESQPLDVGREYRLVTKAIRAALVHRDQGCAFPHCDAPPPACEAHHIRPWWDGGETSVANLVLVCVPSSVGGTGSGSGFPVALAGPARPRHRQAGVRPAQARRSHPQATTTPPLHTGGPQPFVAALPRLAQDGAKIDLLGRRAGTAQPRLSDMEDAEFEHRLARLAGDLGETARLLNRHGEEHWAAWAARCRRGLEARDVAAFERILRAFGGMGSFNDLVIMAVNGHDVDPQQEPAVNDRLDRLRQQVWEDANALARAVRASS